MGEEVGAVCGVPAVEAAGVFSMETTAGETAGVDQREHVFRRASELQDALADSGVD